LRQELGAKQAAHEVAKALWQAVSIW
jgi:hypothetical protein